MTPVVCRHPAKAQPQTLDLEVEAQALTMDLEA